jgi:hypothetical protein
MIQDDQVMERLIEKTQLKRDTYEIIGMQDID